MYFPSFIYGKIHLSLHTILSEHEELYGKIKKGNLEQGSFLVIPNVFQASEI
jgi:hypothetical protein